jgi:hypothetical protein
MNDKSPFFDLDAVSSVFVLVLMYFQKRMNIARFEVLTSVFLVCDAVLLGSK